MATDKQQIIDLEKTFWQAMLDNDAETGASLVADPSLLAGSMGSIKLDPDKYRAMAKQGGWKLLDYDLSDFDVVFANQDTAVVTYTVQQKGEHDGETLEQRNIDSSTWVRANGAWKCVLHTETRFEKQFA